MRRQIFKQLSLRWLFFFVAMAGVTMWADAGTKARMDHVPKEVQNVIDNYVGDSTVGIGFNESKKGSKADLSIQFSEIEAGVPYQVHVLSGDSLDKADENVFLKDLAKPTDLWEVPIRARGKYIYFIKIAFFEGRFQVVGESSGLEGYWQKIRTMWPESTGLNPILIKAGNADFLYFPQLRNHNLLYFTNRNTKGDELRVLLKLPDETMNCTLSDDSKAVRKYIKETILKDREMSHIQRGGGK
jgi:hypothetical protein